MLSALRPDLWSDHLGITDSIEHWQRMIAWVERLAKLDPAFLKKTPIASVMQFALKEDWGGENCSLCVMYGTSKELCKHCPLAMQFGRCAWKNERGPRGHNAWLRVEQSKTWRGWLYHARRMLRQLESLAS